MVERPTWSFEHKRANAVGISEEQAARFRNVGNQLRKMERQLRRARSLEERHEIAQRLARMAVTFGAQPTDTWVEGVAEKTTRIADAIDLLLRKFPARGWLDRDLVQNVPPSWPGHVEGEEGDPMIGWEALDRILLTRGVEGLAEAYAAGLVISMIDQINTREAYGTASTEERQTALVGLGTALATLLDVIWPLQERLERSDVGRYVLTPDLLMTILHSTGLKPPSPDDEEAMHEWLRDTLVPHPVVVVRVPPLMVRLEGEDQDNPPNRILVSLPTGGPSTIPESDLFITTVGTVVRALAPYMPNHEEELQSWLDQYPPATPLIGQVSINAPVVGDPEAEWPATMLNLMVALTPRDGNLGINYIAYVGRRGEDPSPELQSFAAALANIWQKIGLTLLTWWNDPRSQAIRRIGVRRVAPEPMTEPRRGARKRQRRVIRHEVLGENLRWDPELPHSPGMRSSPTVRSFVRGHWAAWPRMANNDPVFRAALDCLPELDPSFLAPGAELDLAAFQGALSTCVVDLLDVNVRQRKADVMDRLMCTLLRLGTRPMSPLGGCPLWRANADELQAETREMCRLRRSWKWPHWRGPEEGDEILAVTFLHPEE